MNKLTCISILFFLLIFGTCELSGQSKPNIIVIFTDDQGYADLGIQGQVNDIETPNIDRLAREGVRMTSGYVTAPQCIPSRAGLLSGRYQQKFGLDHNGTIPMPLDEVFLSQRLKKAGYVTGMAGKWHLEPNHQQEEWIQEYLPDVADQKKITPQDIPFSSKKPYMATERGFDQVYQGALNRYWANYNLAGASVETEWVENPGYRLDVQTEAAVTFIKRNYENPFFFYLSYFAPHVPLEATEKYLNRFPGEMPERRRYALAMMSAIDDGVGKIKEVLREKGVEKNTLIFFISDNGAPLKIEKKDRPISYRGGAWDGSLNDPWVGEKGMISEGGIRVPFIVSWPGTLPKGKVYDKPVISLDVAATSVAVAGLEVDPALDGVNLIPYLKGEKKELPHEYLYWRFWQQSAVRSGKWKYLRAGQREYLFDLESPEHETVNLIDHYPAQARALKQKLENWARELHKPGIPEGKVGPEKKWYDHYFKGV